MTYKPALEADARLAAKNALKIRAALAQSFDARWVYDNYLKTNPIKSGNLAQDRARARAWVMLNVLVNMETLKEVMLRVWAEGYVTGEAFADEQLRFARERNKATDTDIDWANWRPGDRAAALLLRPPDAFKKLLASQGITFKELSDTTIRDIGNAVGEAIELGLPAQRSAKRIKDHVASASRALSIAITEQNRAISFATVNRYKEAGLEKMEWEVSSPCDKCAQNANQVVAIGGTFNSGATQPPQHPHCRCVLLPVLPDFDDPAYTGGGVVSLPDGSAIVELEGPTVKTMPFAFNPKRPVKEWEVNAPINAIFKEKESLDLFTKRAPAQFEAVAKQTIKIQVAKEKLKEIATDGRLKNVHETTSSRTQHYGNDWESKYREMRTKYETENLGVPANLPAPQKPIYGWLEASERLEAADYGSVTIVLKDSVKNRTSLTIGDSLNESAPVLIQDILDGKVTVMDMANASENAYLTRYLPKADGKIGPLPTKEGVSYWEAQVYGGVNLEDIEKIIIPQSDIAIKPTMRLKYVTEETIEMLKQAGIEVVIK